jgi:O-antigen/teichoic acid export membrane protein
VRGAAQVSLAIGAVLSLVTTVVLTLGASAICAGFFDKPDATAVLRIVALGLPGLVISQIALGAIVGLGVMRYSAWLGLARGALRIAISMPLVAVGLGEVGLAIGATATATLACVLSLWFLARACPGSYRPARGRLELAPIMRFALPQTLTVALFFGVIALDSLMLARLGSASDVGVYAIVGGLIAPASVVSTAIGQMFAPRIAARDARGERAQLESLLQRVTYWNTVTSLPLFGGLIAAPVACLGVFGHQYERGAQALAVLALGQLVNTAAGPLGQVLTMTGRQAFVVLDNVAVAVLNLVLCIVLIPRFGLVGAAASTTVALTVVNAVKLAQVMRLLRMRPYRRDFARPLIAGVPAIGAAAIVAAAVPGPLPAVGVVGTGVVLLTVYAAVLGRLGIAPEERELLSAARRRVRVRLAVGGG